MMIDKEIQTDPGKIAEGFNTYFSTIAEKLQSKTSFAENHFSKYLSTPLNFNFLFNSADNKEIILIINSLLNGKATGPHT